MGKAGAGLQRSPKRTAGPHCQLPGTTEPSLAGSAAHVPQAMHSTHPWACTALRSPCSHHQHTGVSRTQLRTSLSITAPDQRDASDSGVKITLRAVFLAVLLVVANKKCGSRCLNLFALARTWSDVLAMLGISDSKHLLKLSKVFVKTLSSNSPSLFGESGQKLRRSGLKQLTQSIPPDKQKLPSKCSQSNPEHLLT